MVLLLLFVVAPLVELYVIIKTGQAIGALNTVALMIAIAFVGSYLIKREGLKVWNRFASQIQAGQVPSKEIADGVCLLLAGALMVAPGFLSDITALLLLLPPTRAVARSWLIRRKGLGGLGGFGRMTIINPTYGGSTPHPNSHRPTRDATDATATEIAGELDS